MRLGIIGLGMVGSAVNSGLLRIGQEVRAHDTKLKTPIQNVLDTELIFVCVPTPQAADGSCDTSIVMLVVNELAREHYKGLVVIKSTVTPGTTDTLSTSGLRLAFCPEFLREKTAYDDFFNNNDPLVIGAYNDQDAQLIIAAHGSIVKSVAVMKPVEAELVKYFCNTFNALRIVFANKFWDICQLLGADYQAVKSAAVKRPNIGDHYLNCNPELRAFGGNCLPKDTSAFAQFIRQMGISPGIFETIVEENRRIPDAAA